MSYATASLSSFPDIPLSLNSIELKPCTAYYLLLQLTDRQTHRHTHTDIARPLLAWASMQRGTSISATAVILLAAKEAHRSIFWPTPSLSKQKQKNTHTKHLFFTFGLSADRMGRRVVVVVVISRRTPTVKCSWVLQMHVLCICCVILKTLRDSLSRARFLEAKQYAATGISLLLAGCLSPSSLWTVD